MTRSPAGRPLRLKNKLSGKRSCRRQSIPCATPTVPNGSQPFLLKPTSYIVGSEDRTIQPELERFLAKRMNAKVTELPSSHVPMLSQPRRVYEVIRDAAGNVQRRAA